jgi:hypothetical protein
MAGRAAHRADHADVGRNAGLGEAGPHPLVFVDPGELGLDQIGQFEVVEEDVEELVARDREDKLVEALAFVAGLRPALTGPAFGSLDPVAA